MNLSHLLSTPTSKDCQRCGLCCAPPDDCDTYVDLEKRDVLQLSRWYRKNRMSWECDQFALSTRMIGQTGPLKGYRVRVCCALAGNLGSHTKCRIHKNRPNVCREFKVGNTVCRRIRRNFAKAIAAGEPERAIT